MGDESAPRDDTKRPANWDRRQMEPDRGTPTDDPGRDRDAGDTRPRWNEAEMAEERADGTRSPRVSDAELATSAGGLSGGGANPGGGERWADRDKR